MRTKNLFSLICLFILSGSLIGQTFTSGTAFPVSVPDAAAGSSACNGVPTAATATVNVTGLSGVVGANNEITATFALSSPANAAGDFVVTLVSPNGISVNIASRLGGCSSVSAWNGATNISVRNGGVAIPADPSTAISTTAYRPTMGTVSGNLYPTVNAGMATLQGVPRNGTWTLEVRDLKANSLVGTITNFALTFNKSVSFDPATVPGSLCSGSTYATQIQVSSVGLSGGVSSFAATTDFVLELSDAAGSFATATEVGRVSNTTSINGPISITIPGGLTPGSGYDLRVRALQGGNAPLDGPITVNGVANTTGNVANVVISGLPDNTLTTSGIGITGGTMMPTVNAFCQTGYANAASIDAVYAAGRSYMWTSSPVTAGDSISTDGAIIYIGNMPTADPAGVTHTVMIYDSATTCSNTATYNAIRREMPATPTITSSGASCAGLTTLTADVTPAVIAGTFEWFDATGTSVYNNPPSADYPNPVGGDYTVVVSDPNSTCASMPSAPFTVNDSATLDVVAFGYHTDNMMASPNRFVEFCSNATYNLSVSGGGAAAIYTWWDLQSVGGPAQITVGPSYVPPASTLYYVETTDSNGCSASYTVDVDVLIAPSPNPIVNASGACGGSILTYQGSVPVGNTIEWFLDGTSTGATTTPYTTPNLGGDYTVRLIHPNTCYAESFPITLIAAPAQPTITTASAANGMGNYCYDGVTPIVLDASAALSGQTYQWYLNSSPIPAANASSHLVTAPGIYNVVVADGICESPFSADFTVVQGPSIPTITTASYCGGATLEASSGPNFQWYENGTMVGTNSDTHITSTTGGEYTVEVTDPVTGCSVWSSDSVDITPIPGLPLTATASIFCVNATNSATLMATGATASQSYNWYRNGALMSVDTTTEDGVYTVSISENGCEGPQAGPVDISEIPDAPTITATSNCVGATLTASANIFALGYEWYLDGINVPAFSNMASITTTTAGAYTVEIYVGTFTICSNISAPYIVIPTPAAPTTNPVSAACLNPTTGTALSASGATGTQTYQWYFNSSAITGAVAANYNAMNTGDYTVRIFDGVCGSAVTGPITVYPQPATPTIGSNNGCVGATLTTANVAGASYNWFLDGNSVAGATNTITANAAGTYTVIVVSPAPALCSSLPSNDKIILSAPAQPTIVSTGAVPAGSFQFCSNGTGFLSPDAATVSASSGPNGPYTYTWSSGVNILGNTQNFTPTTSATFTLLVRNPNGCSRTISQAVTVAQSPLAPTVSAGTPSCSGTVLTSSIGTGYAWYNGGTLISGAASQTYNATATGSYQSQIVNPNGCASALSTAVTVTAVSSPVSIVLGTTKIKNSVPSYSYCTGDKDSLTATVTGNVGIVSYTWTEGAITLGTSAKLPVNGLSVGSHVIVLTVNDGSCAKTANRTINISTSPAAPTLSVNNATVCSGTTVTLSATASGTNTYVFYRNGASLVSTAASSVNTIVPVPSMGASLPYTTTYNVRAEYNGNTTCLSQLSNNVVVEGLNPSTSFNNCSGAALGTTATLCKNSTLWATVAQQPNAGATYTYSWYRSSTLIGTSAKQNLPLAGNHRLRVTETKGGASCTKTSNWTNIAFAPAGCTPVTCRLAGEKDGDEIIEFASDLEMSVYPNPTSDVLNIDIINSGASEGKIFLYNSLGQIVMEKTVALSEGKLSEQLDLSNVSQGIYTLSFQTVNGNKVQKVVKE